MVWSVICLCIIWCHYKHQQQQKYKMLLNFMYMHQLKKKNWIMITISCDFNLNLHIFSKNKKINQQFKRISHNRLNFSFINIQIVYLTIDSKPNSHHTDETSFFVRIKKENTRTTTTTSIMPSHCRRSSNFVRVSRFGWINLKNEIETLK